MVARPPEAAPPAAVAAGLGRRGRTDGLTEPHRLIAPRAPLLAPASAAADRRWRRGLVLSLVLHAGLLIALFSLPPERHRAARAVRGISVDIVRAAPTSAPVADAAATAEAETAAAPAEPPQPQPQQPEPPAMVTATRMLSARILDDPENREVRGVLAGLMDDEQMIQLCSLEGMEQIAAWKPSFRPEQLIAYAMKDARLEGDVVLADGGAVLSRRQWYDVAFRCELTPDHRTVTAFAFRVGDAIPRSEWASHYLSAIDGIGR